MFFLLELITFPWLSALLLPLTRGGPDALSATAAALYIGCTTIHSPKNSFLLNSFPYILDTRMICF